MATYVLVHGAGHGGWCYRAVATTLRRHGHEVYAPTLTGVGDRLHTLCASVDLDTHIADVAKLLFFDDLVSVILVGHSYGGMVITGAADRAIERIAQLVYLDAAIPENGECLMEVSPGLRAFQTGNQTINGAEVGLFPTPELITAVYGLGESSVAGWARPRLTPHPWKTFTQPLRLLHPERVSRIPRTVINCTATLKVRDSRNRDRWFEGDRVWEVDAGHDLMLLQPDAVAAMLLRLAS
jgi:pimeloyl-ACP methyl ester carboxylesterase